MADIEKLDLSMAGERCDDAVLPCPFCGGDSVSVTESKYGGWVAKCGWCGAEIGHPDSKSEAVAVRLESLGNVRVVSVSDGRENK